MTAEHGIGSAQDAMSDGHNGSFDAPPIGQAMVRGTETSVLGADRGMSGLNQTGAQATIAVASSARVTLASALVVAW